MFTECISEWYLSQCTCNILQIYANSYSNLLPLIFPCFLLPCSLFVPGVLYLPRYIIHPLLSTLWPRWHSGCLMLICISHRKIHWEVRNENSPLHFPCNFFPKSDFLYCHICNHVYTVHALSIWSRRDCSCLICASQRKVYWELSSPSEFSLYSFDGDLLVSVDLLSRK